MQRVNIEKLHELYMLHSVIIDESLSNVGSSYKTLSQRVYEIIRGKIISHSLKPGERIVDRRLAEELEVSRSLVREVLMTLVNEELVVMVPRKGFYVRNITKRDVEEIYDVRKVLESYATKLAVPRISDEEIRTLDLIFRKVEEEIKKLNRGNCPDIEDNIVRGAVECDVKLHKMLLDNCENRQLRTLVDKYNSYYVFYRVIDLLNLARAKQSFFEHYKIFEAVKVRNVEQAVKLMEKHIENAKSIILDKFDEYTFG